jgi:uncharacterized SAM-binding protein YcdF (DUF218 family)
VAVVLGSRVYDDGRPSPSLSGRLDEAVALYRWGLFASVIVSGGTEPNGIREADVMKAYLAAHGVPALAIITDAHGDTTRKTAINAAAIMQARGFHSVLVISQYFHMPRCRLALAQAGVAPVSSGPADFFILRDLVSIPREVAGYVVYWIDGGGLRAAKR